MVDEAIADEIISISESFDIPAQVVGKLEASDAANKVTIKSQYGTFTY